MIEPNNQRQLEEQICWEVVDSSKINRVVIEGDFNFPNVDWVGHIAKVLNGMEFSKNVQESFLRQYLEGPTKERA